MPLQATVVCIIFGSMHGLFAFLLKLTIFVVAQSDAPPSIEQDPILRGLEQVRTNQLSEAKATFSSILDKDPKNLTAMINLGIIHGKLGEKGHGIARFRMALSIDPWNHDARTGLDYLISQLEVKELPRRVHLLESLRDPWLLILPLWFLHLCGALLFVVISWFLITWLARRRSDDEYDSPSSPLPLRIPLLSTVLVFVLILIAIKWNDLSQTRGTIISKRTDVLATPMRGSPAVFELFEGLEVLVRTSANGWLQVTYPGGRTGWIPQEDVMITTL